MASAQSTPETAGFDFTDADGVDFELPTGTVASTARAGGACVSRGTRVTMSSSNGSGMVVSEGLNQPEPAAAALTQSTLCGESSRRSHLSLEHSRRSRTELTEREGPHSVE